MKKYQVTSVITVSAVTYVEAESEEQAKELALDRGVQSLCHQCDGDGPGREIWQEWRISADGDPDEGTVEVSEL